MAKSSSSKHNIACQATKQLLHGTKNSSMKKNKKHKFINTSTDNIALINNFKVEKEIIPQKYFSKNTTAQNNQNLPKEKFKQSQEKENPSKRKRNSPKGKQSTPKEKRIPNESSNKQDNKKVNLTPKKKFRKVNDSDSDSNSDSCYDTNGLTLKTRGTSMNDETFEDEEYSIDIPDILGASLAENSDVDDEDFEDEEEDESEEEETEEEEDEENVGEDDSDGEEMTEIKNIQSGVYNKNMVSKLNKNDEYDSDDDDDADDDDVEDADDDNYDESSDESDTDIDRANVFRPSDDEEYEDEEEESETFSLKSLLGTSITDNDDDEDFNEEDEDDEDDDISDEYDEDDDINDEDEDDDEDDISDEEDDDEDDDTARILQKTATKEKGTNTCGGKDEHVEKRSLSLEQQKDIDKRTIFIDNIPKETNATALKKVFGQYGPINNIRFRGIVPRDSKTPKKVAAIKKDIHPKLRTVVAYINYEFEESAKKALCMNGKKFEGNYVNVKIVAKSEQQKRNNKNAVFIGNLKFGTYNKLFK